MNTKLGMVKTDHILFIASGAFHLSKPSDLVPRAAGPPADPRGAQGPQPERFRAHPHRAACLAHRAVPRAAEDRGTGHRVRRGRHQAPAEIAWQVNEKTENIGARRLHTLLERLLEEVSFSAADLASEHSDKPILIDAGYVNSHLGELAEDEDLSRYIL